MNTTSGRADWLARIEKDPSDLEYYVGVARALVGTGEEARARSLLELLDDHLREGGRWALRLQLLKRAGTLFIAADKLHPTLSSTLPIRFLLPLALRHAFRILRRTSVSSRTLVAPLDGLGSEGRKVESTRADRDPFLPSSLCFSSLPDPFIMT